MIDRAVYLDDPVALVADLVLEDGRTYGQCVEPWQRDFFEAAFAVQDDGRPVHRLLYSERRRGESKTEDAAAVALADLLTDPPRHRSYAVAGDQDQAGLIIDSVRGFVARTPLLADLELGRWVVRNPATGSELRIMSADAPTSWGIRPRRVIFDELSLQPDDRLWLSMWTAVAKRQDAQMIALTMAGWDFTSTCWQVREQAQRLPEGWFQSRGGTEPAPWLDRRAMELQQETLHPADFARFWECRWVEPAGAWITREMYEACEVGRESGAAQAGFRYAGFVDVGLVHDATAIAVCHADQERVVLDTMHTLRGTKAQPVQLEVVEDLVAELTQRFHVRQWGFEAPQAVASVQRLQGRLRCRVEARYPTADTQAQLFGTLYRLFSTRRLVLYPHTQLRREALNLVTKTVGGRLKVVDSTSIHQDHVVALGGAADLLVGFNPGAKALEYARLELARMNGQTATKEQPRVSHERCAPAVAGQAHEDGPGEGGLLKELAVVAPRRRTGCPHRQLVRRFGNEAGRVHCPQCQEIRPSLQAAEAAGATHQDGVL